MASLTELIRKTETIKKFIFSAEKYFKDFCPQWQHNLELRVIAYKKKEFLRLLDRASLW